MGGARAPLAGEPWWLEEAPPDETAPPLRGEVEADACVVGGGLTGLWTALALRRRAPGSRVVLLEADRCGLGPSGRNGGFCHGWWASLPRLAELLGPDGALATCRASDGILPAVRALGEDVWLRDDGLLEVAATAAQEEAVERAVRVARSLGVPEQALPLSAAEVAERVRSPVFRRGVFFRDGATVQPARLVRALRRAALAAGVELHELSPAVDVSRSLVATPGGRVRADAVCLATNAWIAGWRPARRRLAVFGSHVVLTEPVPELLAELGWTGGEAAVDARMFLHYFRTTADGRVLMGSGSGRIVPRVSERVFVDGAATRRAEAGLRRLLPALAVARVERAWGGPIDVSADHLPFFGTADGVHYAAGFSGNGVGPSWVAGQVLASLALGADDDWSALPLVRRPAATLPPQPFKQLGGAAIRAAILAVEEADEAGRRPPRLARAVASLPRALGIRVGTR